MNHKLRLPKGIVSAWGESSQEASEANALHQRLFKQLEEINDKFFKACKARMRRRLKGLSYSIEARVATSGEPFGFVSLDVYIGHPGKRIILQCYIKELDDINHMCEEAQAMVKAFRDVQIEEGD